MEELQMWLDTTRTLKMQRGCRIHRCAENDFNTIIEEVTEDHMSSEGRGQVAVTQTKKAVAECQDRRMPKALDMFSYSGDAKRKRDESLVNYIAQLDKHAALPEGLKGHVFLRTSKLDEAAWGTVEHRAEGSYDFDLVCEKFRKLEGPLPSGNGGHRTRGVRHAS
eukprot:8083398-Pyramimonas_sp.AAC.1